MSSNKIVSTLLTILLILLVGVSFGYLHRMASGEKGPIHYAKGKEGFAPIRKAPSNFSPLSTKSPYHALEYRELNQSSPTSTATSNTLLNSNPSSTMPFPFERTPMASFAQVTNNVSPEQWSSPDNNNCTPLEICNNFYKPEHPSSSLPTFQENQKHFQKFSPQVTRVNMYGSNLELGPESVNYKETLE